ncbi:alpha/beta hydrolase [uncultured Paracoccus sp.]|uniref:alpha/beta fold hydrolase n=1 Tax=uncultured Paracoccus sp. TaxID=189685 RepID=UPI002623023A|nr:alpha/beta hydrolase [uncultured Paracoccus sp.]
MFQGFERGRIAVDGVEIAYVAAGDGPPVLLLHGFPQTKALWAQVAPRLAGGRRVICADLRGYGDSGKPQDDADHEAYSFRRMGADMHGLMAALGHDRYDLVGHDRGGRTAHRLALDQPQAVRSLTVMDIVPTLTVFDTADARLASVYWHWFFLSQPAPFPERLIGGDPDFFFETCLAGWGSMALRDFDPAQLDDYRRCWREAGTIHGACADYRAAATIDLDHDRADLDRRVDCPTLVLYGAEGAMARLYDVPATWAPRCRDMRADAVPGGHFFVDLHPDRVAAALDAFLPA